MSLQLAVRITADASGVRQGANDAVQEFRRLDGSLQATEGLAQRTRKAIDEVAQSARRAAIEAATGVRADVGSAARAADIAAYGKSLDDLRAKYNPLFAAQRTYLSQLAEIRQAQRLGAFASAAEADAAIARTKAVFAAQATAMRPLRQQTTGAAAGLQPWQRQQLTAQGFDVFTSLASGMNPALIAAQQGPQIIQAVGGVRPALAALAGVVTPLTGGIGALGAIVAAGALMWNEYVVSTKEVTTALAGPGRAAGATAGQLEAIAQSASRAGDVSVREARAMEAAFLRTGRIGAQALGGLIAMSKDFAATIGADVADGSAQLGQIVADPARGAQQLQQMGLLDGATARLVGRLAEQNRLTEAQTTLLAGLKPRLADAAEATTIWSRSWDAVSNAASNAFQAIGSGIDRLISGPALDEQLANAIDRLNKARAEAEGFRRAQAAGVPTYGAAPDVAAAEAQVADLQEQRRRQGALAAERQRAAEQDRAGSAAVSIAGQSPANADVQRRGQLEREIAALKEGANTPGLTADEQDQIARAIEAKSRALDGLNNAQQIANQLAALDVQIQQARDPVTRADLIARRERLALYGQENDAAKINAQVEAARTRAIEESLGASRNRIADMQEETQARARVNAAVAAGTMTIAQGEQRLQMEAQMRELARAALAAEGAERAKYIEQLNALGRALAAAQAEQSRTAALGILRDQRDQIDAMKAEIGLIGQSEQVRARRLAQIEAEQRIRREGIDAASAEADGIRQQAQALAELSVQQQRSQDAWDGYRQAGEGALDALGDAINGQSVDLKNLLQSISREFIQLSVINPLKNAAFGTNYGTLGDLLGVFTGKKTNDNLPGAGLRSVGTMQVNAGTIIINGGVAGAAGSTVPKVGSSGGIGSDAVAGGTTGVDLSAAGKAIRTIESGSPAGNYAALGPLTKTGDRAYGAYQVMGANIPDWTRRHLGESLTPDQFLADPAAQDRVFAGQFGGYAAKYGPSGAARAWFAGPGGMANGGATDV
ncbi:phage tail length tape measure family protein, partial [Ancylobacter lacus]|uniref:phage tail length tape measure family protein n=1 Tax=Ancylobacter lacus TaxID=2579970 RepID=UPI001BCD0457